MSERHPDGRIYARLEALLRLAEDENASRQERDLALARVAEIAAKYQVNASRLNPNSGQYTQENVVRRVFEVPHGTGLGRYRARGIYSVVEAMGATALLVALSGRPRREGLMVFATQSTMDILTLLLPSLFVQEASQNAAYLREVKEQERHQQARALRAELRAAALDTRELTREIDADIRVHRKSFCLAFFVEAAKTIRAKRSDAVQAAGDSYALVLVGTAERLRQAKDALDHRPTNMRVTRSWYMTAWERGSRAGSEALVGQTEVGLSSRTELT